jgi:hypothetical protein
MLWTGETDEPLNLVPGSLFWVTKRINPVTSHLVGVVRCTLSTPTKFEGLCWCYTCSSSFNLKVRLDRRYEFVRRYKVRCSRNPGPECSVWGWSGSRHPPFAWEIMRVRDFERIL